MLLACFTLAALPVCAESPIVKSVLNNVDKFSTDYQRWEKMPVEELNIVANAYLNSALHDSAYVCYSILAKKDAGEYADVACHAKTCLGVLLYECYGDYKKSSVMLLDAEKMANDQGIISELPYIELTRAAIVLDDLNFNYDYAFSPQVIPAFQRAFDVALRDNNLHLAVISFNNIAYVAMKFNKPDFVLKNIPHIRKAISTYKNTREPSEPYYVPDSVIMKDYALVLAEAMECYASRDYARTLTLLDQLPDKILKKSKDAIARYVGCMHLMKYFALMQMHRDDDALAELDFLETLAVDAGIDDCYLETCWMKVDFYTQHGNTAMANQYQLAYYKKKDAYMRESNLQSLHQAELEFELQQEINKDIERKQYARFLLVGLIGLGIFSSVLAILVALLVRKNRDLREKNLSLYKKAQEMLQKNSIADMPEQIADTDSDQDGESETCPVRSNPSKLMKQILEVMDSSHEIYEPGFQLPRLAELVNSNVGEVSHTINDELHRNFNDLLGEYRIKKACRIMNETESCTTMTVESIAASVGIKSRSNFTSLFKKFTALTPTAYMKIARNEQKNQEIGAKL